MGEAGRPTLSSAAKEHYVAELLSDDMERSAGIGAQTGDFLRSGRSAYAKKLRLLVAGKIEDREAESLIGHAADARIAKDRPRSGTMRWISWRG